MKERYDKDKKLDSFVVGDSVAYYIGDRSRKSRKLRSRFSGPFKIVERLSNNTVRIINTDTNEDLRCHVGMLKLYRPEFFTPEMVFNRTQKVKRHLSDFRVKSHKSRHRRHHH